MQNKSNGVCELIADELEQIAGGGCPDGVAKTLGKNGLVGAVSVGTGLAVVGGLPFGPGGAAAGAASGFVGGGVAGIVKGAFDCILP